jgi:hypothetical protein
MKGNRHLALIIAFQFHAALVAAQRHVPEPAGNLGDTSSWMDWQAPGPWSRRLVVACTAVRLSVSAAIKSQYEDRSTTSAR